MSFVALYAAQAAAAIRTSLADRTNFAMQVGGMLLNDVFFLALWVMFFLGFRSVGGWGMSDMALLMGLIMTIVGAAGVFLGGYRDMAAVILRGELDALLTQPKGLIARLLARESNASGWGDLGAGLLILALFAGLGWRDVPFVLVALAAGLTVYVSAATAFATMAFWTVGARSFARDLTDFMLLLSSYPGSIFQGMTKVIAYTLLPAGFVVMAPVGMLREPTPATFAVVIAGAGAYAALAAGLFQLGLKRYRRGATAVG